MLRKPTQEEIKEAKSRKPIYKVVRVEGGELKSLWVTGTKRKPIYIEEKPIFALTYRPEYLTSNGKYGVWCTKTKKVARHQPRHNGQGLLTQLFRAWSIGKAITAPPGWRDEGAVLYPAIILDKEPFEIIDKRQEVR